ncbi:MAG: flagellar M-ring protein FliF, partial [Firmicutes bacterium]|nr:flagellar M-ring protein FliF [Bacillota bacterium]
MAKTGAEKKTRNGIAGSLGTGRMIAIAVVAAVVLAGLITLIVYTSGSDYSLLFGNLSPEDGAAIVEYLRESGVRYKLGAGGTSVSVPADKVYELRMELASKGYPQGAGSGFELFDKMSFGATEFTQKVNYVRSLQGELARTIMSLTPVAQARVHIVIPEERLFSEQQEPTTASIVVKLRPGSRILDPQVRGIVHLASTAIRGLTPDNITVIDTEGNLLWRGQGQSPAAAGAALAGLTTSQLDAKMAFEQEMQRRIETMLERVLGIGRAVVRVYADFNFDTKETETQTFQPLPTGYGIPISEQTSEEQRIGTPAAEGGAAGTASNVAPTYPMFAATTAQAATYTRTDRTTN